MRKNLLLVVLIIPLLSYATDITYQVEKSIKSVVVVEGYNNGELTLGSGFFIDSYHIVTNYHVINNLKKLYIRSYLYPVTSVPVKVIGYDQFADVAILKINDYYPFFINWAVSNVENGQYVYIIGHPFGYEFSISSGLVSSNSRYDEKYPFINLFQTDALIQTGSSGSPVFNKNGLVIGMVKSTVNTENSSGISMAIDYRIIKDSISKIFKTKQVRRPNLLFAVPNHTKHKPKTIALNYPKVNTDYITVISINGIAVKNNHEANQIIQSLDIGDVVKYKYLYNSVLYEKTVILENLK